MTSTSESVLKPGQLWRWTFNFAGGEWFLVRITEKARNSLDSRSIITIKRDDLFSIVSTSDPGPYQFYDPSMNHRRKIKWCTIMLKDWLCWMDVAYFEVKKDNTQDPIVELISDV